MNVTSNTFFHYLTRRYALFFIVSFSLSFLASCTTMSVGDCQSASWSQLGKADGAKGRLPDYIYTRANNCIKNGIQPDISTWEMGRQAGLADYCTAANAAAIGRRGDELSPVCGFLSTHRQQQLLKAHERGFKIHLQQKKIERIKTQISENNKRIREYQEKRDKLLKDKRDFKSGLKYGELNDKIKSLQEHNAALTYRLSEF